MRQDAYTEDQVGSQHQYRKAILEQDHQGIGKSKPLFARYGVGEVDGAEVLLVVVIVADVELVGEGEDGAFIFHVADDVGDVGDLACAKKAVRTVLLDPFHCNKLVLQQEVSIASVGDLLKARVPKPLSLWFAETKTTGCPISTLRLTMFAPW